MNIKIEHNVPLPNKCRRGELTMALKSLKVGDSFLWPAKNKTSINYSRRLAEVSVIVRTIDEDNVRVWRIK